MGAVAIQEVECLMFCIFWCQLPKILKARQKCNASDEKKVTAQIQNLFASAEGRKTVQDFELGGLGVDSLEGSPTCGASWAETGNRS